MIIFTLAQSKEFQKPAGNVIMLHRLQKLFRVEYGERLIEG
jgi:hypothetical protein